MSAQRRRLLAVASLVLLCTGVVSMPAQQNSTVPKLENNGTVYLFDYHNRFVQLSRASLLPTAQGNLLDFGAVKKIVPQECTQQYRSEQDCDLAAKYLQYSPRLNAIVGVFPAKGTNGESKVGEYSVLALRVPDFQLIAEYRVHAVSTYPMLIVSGDEDAVIVAYERNSSEPDTRLQFLDELAPLTLQRVVQHTGELNLQDYLLAKVTPGLRLSEKAHFGPSKKTIYDGLFRVSISANGVVSTRVNPLDKLSAEQKKILEPFAELDPPSGRHWYNFSEADSKSNVTLLWLRSADRKSAAFWTVNLDTEAVSPVFVAPAGEAHLSPDGTRVILQPWLATGSDHPTGHSGMMIVYDVSTGKEVARLADHRVEGSFSIDHQFLCFYPDGSELMYMSSDRLLSIGLDSVAAIRADVHTDFRGQPGKSCVFTKALPQSVRPTMSETTKPLGAQLRVRWDGHAVIVIKDGVKHTFEVDKDIMAYALHSVKLLSAKAVGSFTYLLFDISGQSRGPEDAQSYCGAGEERSLIWMKLDSDWKRVDSRSFVIESCWDTASLEDEGAPLTFNGPDLLARGTTTRDPDKEDTIENRKWMRYEVKYSIKHPEDGLQVSLKPERH